jgi:hypothetical protein
MININFTVSMPNVEFYSFYVSPHSLVIGLSAGQFPSQAVVQGWFRNCPVTEFQPYIEESDLVAQVTGIHFLSNVLFALLATFAKLPSTN